MGRHFETGITAWLVKRHSLIRHKSSSVTPVCQFSVKCVVGLLQSLNNGVDFTCELLGGLIYCMSRMAQILGEARAHLAPWSQRHWGSSRICLTVLPISISQTLYHNFVLNLYNERNQLVCSSKSVKSYSCKKLIRRWDTRIFCYPSCV